MFQEYTNRGEICLWLFLLRAQKSLSRSPVPTC